MKKIRLISLMAICLLLIFLLTSCVKGNYGGEFTTREELENFLLEANITLLYPSVLPGSDQEGAKNHFVANTDSESQEYVGYKIYCFSEPFLTAVYGYNYTTEKILSDIPERLSNHQTVSINSNTFTYYTGSEHKDSIFLLGYMNINGAHYELRIIGNDRMVSENYVNYIYPQTDLYNQALEELIKMAQSLV